ncbi:dolichyl-P-Man:Man(5)GlcNAc(2)-PP-dolichol alpha-1,3-mannosyltransferase [Tulasnella sp. 331]|nr:dolichyl-P-Man:Man(5)GlcNAc(2)-PP-dolichol alpha-1,3-mannosyltransferase [Tulasnella sp. 331]
MISYTISNTRKANLDPSQAFGLTFSSYSNPPEYIVRDAVEFFSPPPSIADSATATTESNVTPATTTPAPASPQSSNTSVSLQAGKQSHDESTTIATTEDAPEQSLPSSEEAAAPTPEQAPALITSPAAVVPSAPPIKVPPKSWSALFNKPAASSTPKVSTASNPSTPQAISSPPRSSSSLPHPDRTARLASGSAQPKIDPTSLLTNPSLSLLIHPAPLLHPRGLVNTGNMCFANSILQVLLYCPPFWRLFIQGLAPLFDEVGAMGSGQSHCTLLQATLGFIREFRLAEDVELPKDPLPGEVGGRGAKYKANGGPTMTIEKMRRESFLMDSFIPEFMYDAMKENKRFANMQKGHQEDAEEFLGFFLDTIHEELIFVTERLQSNPTPAFSSPTSHPPQSRRGHRVGSQSSISVASVDDEEVEAREVHRPMTGDMVEDDGWLEVGKKNKVSATRTTKSSESIMTKIFGGKFRSILRMPGGAKTSATLEPYQPLQLDIQPDSVQSVMDALKHITVPETVSMRSPKGYDVPATKQVFIETLPAVLVLHIKRFIFEARDEGVYDVIKSQKVIGYGTTLEIPKDALSPLQRQGPPIRYQLFGVIYHHGKHATGGHYTVDVLRQDHSEWLRIDDTHIEPIPENQVVTLDSDGRRNVRAEGMRVNTVTGEPDKMATFATKTASALATYQVHLIKTVKLLLIDKRYFWHLATLIIVGDAILTHFIIRFISFTEIDYETYMEQVACYEAGERSYTFLTGPSGPLVYPAGHLWIHRLLRVLTVDGEGINIHFAQQVYAALYSLTLFLACAVYDQSGGLPNYVLIPLVLSKRLHSIFVLRLFNDCWVVALVMASVLAYQKKRFPAGSVLFSLALSVKMNILLYFPGLLVVLVQNLGIAETAGHVLLIGLIQVAVAWPFLSTYPTDYFHAAFDFSRQFLYTWTVNWRFLSEDTFLSSGFAKTLTLCHVATLVASGFVWCRPDDGVVRVLKRAFGRPGTPAGKLPANADRIATILFTSNLIGILFARSLHYQFYSWYAHQLPFLMWRTRFPLLLKIVLLGAVDKGDQKSRVTKSTKFYGGRWQILLYPNSGHEGGYVSLYLSCEPTQEEKDSAVNGRWTREGLFKFSFDLKSVSHAGTSQVTYNTKEACDHAFSWKTMNWGWAQFAKRDAVYYNAVPCKAADAFLIVCTITSSPVSPTLPSTVPKAYIPRSLIDSIGSMLDDPTYSDVEFVLPSKLKRGVTRRIYANQKMLSRAEYFDTMFKSGFAEAGERDLASLTNIVHEPIHLEDSDESDAEDEPWSPVTDDMRSNLARKPRSVGTVDHDAATDTQSDTGAAVPSQPTAVVSLHEDDADMVNSELAGLPEADRTEQGSSEHTVTESNPSADHSKTMRQASPPKPHSPAVQVAEVSPAQAESQPPVIPGPPKKIVVIRDGAYTTYYAFLYYLYTDSIVFAPFTSSFVGYSPAGPSTPQQTPGISALGLTSQSYFAPSTNITQVLARPRSTLAPGGNLGIPGSTAIATNEDEAPRSRKEWVEQWKSNNPSRPFPVSAKAVYKLADKNHDHPELDLAELKQHAFEHIVRSLTPANIPYEVFSSFSAHYEEIRKVQVDYFLAHWSEIRNGEAMRNVFQQIRLGRHPGFEEIWPLIVQHLVFRPDGAAIGVRGGAAKSQSLGEGRERSIGGEL